MNVLDNLAPVARSDDAQWGALLAALSALRKGDAAIRLPLHWPGVAGKVADAFNDVVEQNASMAEELSRLRQVVGKEGKLKQRASLREARGFWGESIDCINALIDDLVHPTSEVARVIGAVAQGDLNKSMALEVEGRPLEGEFLRTAKTINTMVEQLGDFSAEVTRVAREVGTEGKLGGQAKVKGVAGTWKDLTDSVNSMAGNLTDQVRNIADVTTAVAKGDLSKKIDVDVKGEFLTLKNTINTMVDQLRSFASEVTRVAREVGTEGSLGGQAQVEGVSGTWKDLTDSVNSMAGNLTSQVRNIADVTKAVAAGDLSKKITVDVKGEILELKNTVNTMVDQLRSFAAEVTRVAREVGTEGKLGGQADVQGVAGTWKDLTESVNFMAGNLTSQVRNIAEVTTAVAAGDLSKKITVDVKGEISELKNTINTMVDQLRSFAAEVTRVAREVGTEGKLGGQADVQGVAGTWKDLTDSVNLMASNLTSQVRNIADVTKAVAAGNLSEKITVDVKGEILELKATINTMVDQLSSFAAEVTRVAREVGTEGRLGGQAQVTGVSGTWKDLTDNVNFMAGNLTSQVRGIAKVVTAVADGDLKQKLTVEAKGEIAALADTINSMTDTLAIFADQVTGVAREVGVEGKLGGQAKVPGASGTWKGLTENVNELAANLTTQVRAIAEVATAVTQGDLTRSITVDTQGEVASLKDTINEMIRNLKDTTQKNTEQDWLKTNLAKFTRMLQGQRDLVAVGQLILSELAPVVGVQQAEFYVLRPGADSHKLKLFASYASGGQQMHGKEVGLGEGLVGQCALDKQKVLLTNVASSAFRIASGLSENAALDVLVLPVVFEGEVRGVLELASLQRFNPVHEAFLTQLTESIGIVINTIEANSRTESLLEQSQSLAEELQNRQQELQQTNDELQDKARLLAHQNQEVERKNAEVEQARQALEEKAEQLALTSKYKSEFLANMSHELRTPLNSLLILSDQLCRNPEGNLSGKQVEFSKTIHASGNDLLMLINDILDLSKIESGTVAVDVSELRVEDLHRSVERSFRHFAESKHVDFLINVAGDLPKSLVTDVKRLQQIIKNLLSNAFKFTHQGHVTFSIAVATEGWSPDNESLNRATQVLAFAVADTGIGISADKQQIIFEAFQQADGSTSRKYGGTGLGLAISRELSRLLGGEIRLVSVPGSGSTFTLYLPHSHVAARPPRQVRWLNGDKGPDSGTRPKPPVQQSRAALRPVGELHESAGEGDGDGELFQNPADDDRGDISSGDRVLLIVENDLAFGKVLLDAARLAGFKGLVSGTGAGALTMVREYQPAAITLDIFLPDMQGWRVLDRLKTDQSTRHVPICVVSTDESRERAFAAGAIGFLAKPLQSKDAVDDAARELYRYVERGTRRLLVAMPGSPARSEFLLRLDEGIETVVVQDAAAARAALTTVDAAVIDAGLDGLGPEDVAEAIEARGGVCPPAVVVHAPGGLSDSAWNVAGGAFALRRSDGWPATFAQATAVLHRNPGTMSEEQRNAIDEVLGAHRSLAGKKALIVDDDMRNIFALATVLDNEGMVIVSAGNGREAIRLVEADPTIDIVLMDIMMPEMDGMETMREIRKLPRGRDLPMVAVTAKAMKGDRQKCIEAGAWDYLSKPVDPMHLLAALRGWLCR
ncbi:HAMP domain-containing protein [Piscinibacter gummiphilus]|uniref:Virulence sensor protein BvgS n=1 Tax=Piscinibacter gummiphilus TaxID=946333 RepID=A0A1W6L994_9BURK|nr:HAMP domain-containing protein [Piscinibacter gummiphilus]ARN20881.1 hybrid sensor histidine kinase/response regulator [Piscinibacter gummiphilus]ATU65557.1 hybrid sensor histidine kinase/response regulator [Piscinibacter gummiphilus]GLS94720.1 histidine kinase [Piscinibacter gummiphilus]